MTSNSILGIYSHEHTHKQQSRITTAVLYKIKWYKGNDPKGHQEGDGQIIKKTERKQHIHVTPFPLWKRQTNPHRQKTAQ